MSLDSHDQLTKNIEAFAATKGLALPKGLIEMMRRLKSDVADYRDYAIAHEKSPRTMRATSLSSNGLVSIVHSKIFPNYPLQQVETKPLNELFNEVDEYLALIIAFAEGNRQKTNLQTKAVSAD